MLLEQLGAGRVASHLVVLAGVSIVYTLVLSAVVAVVWGAEEVEVSPLANLVATVGGGLVMAATALALLRESGGPWQALGLTARRLPVNLAWGVLVAVCSFAAFMMAAWAMIVVWPAGYQQLLSNPGRINEMIPRMHPVWLCLLMGSVSVYEEVLFRGVLVTHLRRLTRSWTVAVVGGAVIFAALHIGEGVGSQVAATSIPLFAVAIVWSLAMIRFRSLVPAIVGHFLFNMIQLALLRQYGT